MTRLSDLRGKRVRRENGEGLGRVYEVHIAESRVTALICGGLGFLQRLTTARGGHRVPWEQVVKVTAKEIIILDKRP
jgi:sporulation protein YlmC with PRC-barrel domain